MTDERAGQPSASSWRRFELCPGSYRLSLEARELGQEAHLDSPSAERGTRIHAWLAGDSTIQLNDDERETAEKLLELTTEQRNRIFGDQEVKCLREKRLWLRNKL